MVPSEAPPRGCTVPQGGFARDHGWGVEITFLIFESSRHVRLAGLSPGDSPVCVVVR
jgi:hypothetical protein